MNNSPACACVAIDQDSPTPLYIEMLIADYHVEKTGPAPCDIFDTIYLIGNLEAMS